MKYVYRALAIGGLTGLSAWVCTSAKYAGLPTVALIGFDTMVACAYLRAVISILRGGLE